MGKLYTDKDGLPSATVYCVYQDKDGYLWFGTENGVSRFNGREFKNYSKVDGLADNEVFNVFQDSKGRVWFSAFNGQLSYYLNGQFYNSSNSELIEKVTLPAYWENIFEDSHGNLWFNIYKRGVGVLTMDGEIKRFSDNPKARNVYEMDGSVFLHSLRYGEYQLSSQGEIFDMSRRSTRSRPNDLVRGFEAQIKRGGSFKLSHVYIEEFFKKKYGMSLPSKTVSTKINHFGDEFWVCSYNGVYRFIEDEGGTLKSQKFYQDKVISDVLKDREGAYWVTTIGDGVIHIPSINVTEFKSVGQKAIGTVNRFFKDGDRIWFGGLRAKVGYWENGEVELLPYADLDYRGMIKSFEYGSTTDAYLLGSDNGFYVLNKKKHIKLHHINFKLIKRWDDERYVIGTSTRLVVVKRSDIDELIEDRGRRFKKFETWLPHVKPEFLNEEGWILDVARIQDGILVGTNRGLFELSESLEYNPVLPVKWANERINDVLVDEAKGHVFAASHGGGLLYNLGDEWFQLDQAENVKIPIIKRIWLDETSMLWMATEKGVFHAKVDEHGVGPIEQFRIIAAEEINDVLTHDGKLFVAKSDGLSVIDIEGVAELNQEPTVKLSEILLDAYPVRTDSLVVNGTKPIQISFDGIHFLSRNDISYKYRLTGLDKQWNYTKNASVNYGQLSPGEYKFEVKSISGPGIESPETATLQITVLKQFWQQTWFIVIAALAFLSLAFILVRALFKKSQEKERRKFEMQVRLMEAERKALQAQLNPHFIFNALTAIQNMIVGNKQKDASQYLSKFSKLIRRVLDFSDISMIRIAEEIETLRLYLEIEKLRMDHQFDYEIEIEDTVELNSEVPSMIIQPYVENAIWHGIQPLEGRRMGRLIIRIQDKESGLRVEVEDNGVGRRDTAKGTGTQLAEDLVSQTRAGVSGEVYIEDLFQDDVPSGTRVVIQLFEEPVYD